VFREAFGDLATEAMRTRFGQEWDVRIEDASHPPVGGGGTIADYWIRRGTLSRVRPQSLVVRGETILAVN
jgi:hypothetical protein